jgi:hypothetical protein
MSQPSTAMRPSADPLAFARYLDVALVILAAPFVILTGAPVVGYLAGTAAWIVNRALGTLGERVGRKKADVRAALGLNLGILLLRAWIVALTILVVGLAGSRKDGLMAALLLLVAFTVYFAMSLILRPLDGKDSSR